MGFSLATILAGAFDPVKIVLTVAIVLTAYSGRWIVHVIAAISLLAYVLMAGALFGMSGELLLAHLVSIALLIGIWTLFRYRWGWKGTALVGVTMMLLSVGTIYVSSSSGYGAQVASADVEFPAPRNMPSSGGELTSLDIAYIIRDRIQAGTATPYLAQSIRATWAGEMKPDDLHFYMHTTDGRLNRLLIREIAVIRGEHEIERLESQSGK